METIPHFQRNFISKQEYGRRRLTLFLFGSIVAEGKEFFCLKQAAATERATFAGPGTLRHLRLWAKSFHPHDE